jgi:hypothetical protein
MFAMPSPRLPGLTGRARKNQSLKLTAGLFVTRLKLCLDDFGLREHWRERGVCLRPIRVLVMLGLNGRKRSQTLLDSINIATLQALIRLDADGDDKLFHSSCRSVPLDNLISERTAKNGNDDK